MATTNQHIIEIWKDVINYEGLYQISNLGNFKSLNKTVLMKGKHPYISNEKFIKGSLDCKGYLNVTLVKDKIRKTKQIHQLVAQAFLSHTPCGHKLVIDHIDNNPLNNSINNLRIVTNRENTSKGKIKGTSKYTGVCWSKEKSKWHSRIDINNKTKHLGYFSNEVEASNAYKSKLNSLLL